MWNTYHHHIRRILPWLGLIPALSLIALLAGISIVYGISQSLGYLPFIGQETINLDAYHNLLIGPSRVARQFWPALGFSLWVSGASAVLAALGALLLVLLVPSRTTGHAGGLIMHLNLAFPHLVWAIGLSLLLSQSGLVARVATLLGLIDAPADFPVLVRDSYGIGIILAYASKGVPFLALIALAIMRSQPEEYHLVAQNLGATPWQRLWHVTFPLVLPGLLAGALLVFAFSFGAYEVPAIVGVRFPRMLAVLALEFFLNADLHSRAEGMAISVVMAVVVLIVAGVSRSVQARREER